MELLVQLDQGEIDFIVETNLSDQKVKEVKVDSISTTALTAIELPKPIVKITKEAAPKELVKEISKDIVKINENKYILNIKPIYFDYESSYLTKDAKIELAKVVAIMKKNPEMIIESGSHTDAKGPKKYNKWLSDRRARRTVDFIVQKGISRNRISGRGYGDSQISNRCSKGIDCSENEHAQNRRTEFVVINSNLLTQQKNPIK